MKKSTLFLFFLFLSFLKLYSEDLRDISILEFKIDDYYITDKVDMSGLYYKGYIEATENQKILIINLAGHLEGLREKYSQILYDPDLFMVAFNRNGEDLWTGAVAIRGIFGWEVEGVLWAAHVSKKDNDHECNFTVAFKVPEEVKKFEICVYNLNTSEFISIGDINLKGNILDKKLFDSTDGKVFYKTAWFYILIGCILVIFIIILRKKTKSKVRSLEKSEVRSLKKPGIRRLKWKRFFRIFFGIIFFLCLLISIFLVLVTYYETDEDLKVLMRMSMIASVIFSLIVFLLIRKAIILSRKIKEIKKNI